MRHAVLIVSMLLGSVELLHATEPPTAEPQLIAQDHAETLVKILVYLDQVVAQEKALRAQAEDAYNRGATIAASCLGPTLAEANAAVETARTLRDGWQRALRNEQFGRRTLARLEALTTLSKANFERGHACLDRKELAAALSAASAVRLDASTLEQTTTEFPFERMNELRRPPLASPY